MNKFCILILTLVAILQINCTYERIIKKEIPTLKLTVNLPVLILKDNTISFLNISDSVFLTYYENWVLYKLPPSRNLKDNEQISGTETYFVFEKSESHGVWFQSLDSIRNGRKLLIDSFLNIRAFRNISFSLDSNDSLTQTIKFQKSNGFLEKYVANNKTDELNPDSAYLYFSDRLKNYEYSFSPPLDSLKEMKLFKVRLLFNETFSKEYEKLLPKRELSFEIGKVVTKEENRLLRFFKELNQIRKNK